jgi:lysophospholipase L1-like esterase
MFGFGLSEGWALQPRRGSERRYVALPAYASIAAFGDSITAGTGVSTAANRWANRIGTSLGATVLNAGVSGTVLQNSADSGGSPRSGNGRDRFVAALTSANLKEAVFIAYGFNDARYVGAPATFNGSNYASDYREVLNGLLTLGYAREDVYVLAPYYITDSGLNTYGADPNFAGQTRGGFEAFVAAAETVAGEFGVRFCNLYRELNTPEFIGNVDGNDHIHPTDAGHGLIATVVQSRTVEPNGRAAPTSVTANRNGSDIDAGCAAVSGATGYEFVPVGGYADRPSETSAGPSVSFTGLPSGRYRIKARATFGDGSKSPWTFAAADVLLSGSGPFLQDSFTDTVGAGLSTHTPETGGAWAGQSGVSSNGQAISSAGRLRNSSANGMYQNAGAPPFADYYAEADLVHLSAVANHSAGIAVRMQSGAHTAYWARFLQGTGWQLYKTVAGTSTQLGATQASPAFAPGQTKRLRLEVSGTVDPVLTLKIDGTTVLTMADNSGTRISAAGKAGTRCVGSVSDTTGIHLDNFEAGPL